MDLTQDIPILNQATRDNLNKLQEQVDSMTWMHSIDLGNGLKSKGKWGDHTKAIWNAVDKVDFRGKKVLDIGCCDGLWSFEAEKRGAREIYAIDDLSQRSFVGTRNSAEHVTYRKPDPTFQFASSLLRSKAKYFPDVSVYDLKEKLAANDFDVVIFCGVYYHLRHPLLALSKIRSIMKTGATIIVEGVAITNEPKCFAEYYYGERFIPDDPTCWWVPTVPCLKQWVEGSFFKVLSEENSVTLPPTTKTRDLKNRINTFLGKEPERIYSRHILVAKAVSGKDPKHGTPDADLDPFNQA